MAERRSNAPSDGGKEGVSSRSLLGEPAGGAHEIRPLSEQDWAAQNLEYRVMPDEFKPDPSTVAEVQILPEDK